LSDAMIFSTFMACTFFSNTHFGHSLPKAEWAPVQFAHLARLWQSVALWPTWPQVAQVVATLQVVLPWEDFWQVKHRSRFGMYTETEMK